MAGCVSEGVEEKRRVEFEGEETTKVFLKMFFKSIKIHIFCEINAQISVKYAISCDLQCALHTFRRYLSVQ